jgi:rhamnulokinase
MLGGGIQNKLLCQFTANAIGRPVWAGPVEASSIGNVLVQYMTLGELSGLEKARSLVRRSFPLQTYEPQESAVWNEAYGKFCRLLDN